MSRFRINDLIQNEKIRFLAVGSFNTLIGYLTFSILQFRFGQSIGYIGSLIISHLFVSILAFYLYRKLVFKVQGRLFLDFIRFQGVYSISLILNIVILPMFVQVVGINPYFGQALSICVVTILSFIGHKLFSFRRTPPIIES